MKSTLKSDSRKVIIRIQFEGENFYVSSIDKDRWDNIANVVRLTGNPGKAKKLVRQSTIDTHIKSINEYYISNILNLHTELELFRLDNEYLQIISQKAKDIISERLEYYKNLVIWEDDNFDIKKAFKEKDWSTLRKLKTKLALLFENEQEYNKLKNINLDTYSTFTISVVDAKQEVRAQKLRIIQKHG